MSDDTPSKKISRLTRPRLIALLVQRFHLVESNWDDRSKRISGLKELRSLLTGHPDEPFLGTLADHLDPETITLPQLYTLLVPIEREHQTLNLRDEDFVPSTQRVVESVESMPVTVVVDNLRSAFNVGGIFRTSECMGIGKIVLAGYTATPQHSNVQKAALGATDQVSWETVPRIEEALSSDLPVVAIEQAAGSKSLFDFSFDFPCVVVLGNERFGLNPSVVEQATDVVHIPMFGQKQSLNVVSAFAMCAYEMRRQFDATAANS